MKTKDGKNNLYKLKHWKIGKKGHNKRAAPKWSRKKDVPPSPRPLAR